MTEGHPEPSLNTTQHSAQVKDWQRDQPGEMHDEDEMEQGEEAEQSEKVNKQPKCE